MIQPVAGQQHAPTSQVLHGRRVKSAAKQFSFLGPFVSADNPTFSHLTQQRLGWRPTQPGVLADLDNADYFKA